MTEESQVLFNFLRLCLLSSSLNHLEISQRDFQTVEHTNTQVHRIGGKSVEFFRVVDWPVLEVPDVDDVIFKQLDGIVNNLVRQSINREACQTVVGRNWTTDSGQIHGRSLEVTQGQIRHQSDLTLSPFNSPISALTKRRYLTNRYLLCCFRWVIISGNESCRQDS